MTDKDKMLKVLADALDGCPLTEPCDKLFGPDGWCRDHCKSQEPDAECWLKYAEVVAEKAKNLNEEVKNSNGKALDTISRQAAIALANSLKDDLPDDERMADAVMAHNEGIMEYQTKLSLLPSVQPEMTDERAILHLQSTGWMQNHDREMYESGLREQLADDSGSYDSLIPCEDAISRRAAIDIFDDYNVSVENGELEAYSRDRKRLCDLPPAQPETTTMILGQDKDGIRLWYKCSNCGEPCVADDNYCSYCGRRFVNHG